MSEKDSGPSAFLIFAILMVVIFISGTKTNSEMSEVEERLDKLERISNDYQCYCNDK